MTSLLRHAGPQHELSRDYFRAIDWQLLSPDRHATAVNTPVVMLLFGVVLMNPLTTIKRYPIVLYLHYRGRRNNPFFTQRYFWPGTCRFFLVVSPRTIDPIQMPIDEKVFIAASFCVHKEKGCK